MPTIDWLITKSIEDQNNLTNVRGRYKKGGANILGRGTSFEEVHLAATDRNSKRGFHRVCTTSMVAARLTF